MITPQELYANIEQLAWSRGMTVRTLCIEAEISPNLLSKLKTGKGKDIQLSTAKRLSEALKCSVDDFLLSGDPHNKETSRPSNSMARFKEQEFLDELSKRQELRRLFRAAVQASPKQVNSAAALLETINEKENDNENRKSSKQKNAD